MTIKKISPQELRAEAEAKLAAVMKLASCANLNERLVHELGVHQIELEMQNEQLRQMQTALEASRDRYLDLYEFAPVAYLMLDKHGLIQESNLTGATLLGVERRNLLQRRFAGFVDSVDSDRWHLFFTQLLKQNQRKSIDLQLNPPNGKTLYVQLDCLLSLNQEHSPQMRVALTDITERMAIEVRLRVAATAFESQEGMVITDANNNILQVNKAFTEMTGYTAEEVIGKNPRLFQSGKQSREFYAAMWKSIHECGQWAGEIWNRRKNGEIYPEYLAITAVKNQDGIVSHYVASIVDITERKAAADEIEKLAFYDPLTDLPNRRLLLDRLKLALVSSHRSGLHGALLFIDLDHFKRLNDTYGHDMGDLLLQQVAERLIFCVRENDTVARLGGDEFIVMLEDLSAQSEQALNQTKVIGKKILDTLNQVHQLINHIYHNTPSIGAILFNGHQQSIEELLKQIDIAMYSAKVSGRNALHFFDPEMQITLTDRVALEADLRLAIVKDQFKLYYQAQTTHNGKIVGAEVLIRWQHPQRGLIMPADFIPLAEETGLIVSIGQWILEVSCRQLKIWESDEQTRDLQLAVNVSARQFHQTDFVEQVCQTIRRTAIKPELLKLELTESLVLDNIVEAVYKMNELKKTGVQFAMDDFGTGYSSLAYLTQLPFSQLKIDRSFVQNIGVKTTDAIIIQTIIGMTENLGMDVIAEGVETEAQRVFLEQHGCPFYQGFLCSKPVPIEQFEAVLIK